MNQLYRENFSCKPTMLTQFNVSQHRESELYVIFNKLYKFYGNPNSGFECNPDLMAQLEDNLQFLSEHDISKYCVKTDGKVYINNELVAFRMHYYNDYQDLGKYIQDIIPFEERLNIVNQILTILGGLEEIGYQIFDCHIHNFIYNSQEKRILVCDHLSGTHNDFVKIKSKEIYTIRKLLTILSILFNYNFYQDAKFVDGDCKKLLRKVMLLTKNMTLKIQYIKSDYELSRINFKEEQFPIANAQKFGRKLVMGNKVA